MKLGDILLVNYFFDPVGILIKFFTHSHWNHVAWALNGFVVIEACGRGIKTTSLTKYLNNKFFTIKLIRFKDLNKKQIQEITKDLVSQRKKIHYWKFFVSYWMVLLGIKPLVKNCSNFIYFALKKVNHGIAKTNKKFINPEDYNLYPHSVDVSDELPVGAPWKSTRFSFPFSTKKKT
jgi:hypothetical protein